MIGAMYPRERYAVSIIALIAIFRMLGLFALLPVLAIFAAEFEGATPTLIGLTVGGYGLTQAALQIPFGALSDRIGRVPVILLGLALFAAGSILAALSDNIYGVIGGRFLQGAGAISATLIALLADATREKMRTRSMAIFGIGVGSSFLLALIVGPLIAAATGVRSLFWMAAAFSVLSGVLLALLPQGIQKPEQAPQLRLSAAFRPDLIRLDIYIFLLHTVLTASFVALPLLLRDELSILLDDHWKIYVGAITISLIGTLPLIMADERQGKTVTVAVAIGLMFVGQLLLALVGSATVSVFISIAFFFAGFNFLEAGLPARLSLRAPGDARGASLGVFSSSQFLGAFTGGLLGGYFLESGKPALVFGVCAVITFIWLIVHRFYKNAD